MADIFSILTYDFDKQSVPNLSDVFQTVASVTLLGAVAGTYEIGYSFQVDFNGTKGKPLYFRLGGTYGDPTEFSTVSEQNADKKNRFYAFPKVHAGGDITVSLDMRKDATIGTLDVDFVDTMIRRVK